MLNRTISANLANALTSLNIGPNILRDNNKELLNVVSPREHAKALFTYLNMGGYLVAKLIQQAVTYNAAVKPLAGNEEIDSANLINVCQQANSKGRFYADYCIGNFAAEEYSMFSSRQQTYEKASANHQEVTPATIAGTRP